MAAIPYRNPVYSEEFADPFVWKNEGEYYAIGTGRSEARGISRDGRDPAIFPLLRSTDLVNWRSAGAALIPPDPALGTTFWAPEVATDGRRWYLYYSVGHGDRLHQIRVAVADTPLGPYDDAAALTDLDGCAFAIDPHPFRDDDGRWYLFHARDFLTTTNERGLTVRVGTALVVRELTTMTQLSAEETTVARARCDWQRFAADRMMYGQLCDWHTLEGPFVVKDRNRYFCLFSGGCWQTSTYGVDYVAADTVLGEYSDEGVERGPRILRTVPDRVIGPGHCSVVVGPDAVSRYLVYHAWDPEHSARRMCIDGLSFEADGPRCDGPTWTTQRMALATP
jgi:GH43 family beta-xylosidase